MAGLLYRESRHDAHPRASGRGGPIYLSCLHTVVISVKEYFLGA